MSDVLVKPAFQSTYPDTGDATRFGPTAWNAARVFSGGVDGEHLVRDAASLTGATWEALPEETFLQSGTGAVSRTVDSRLRDTLHVKDFGAVGGGVVDDTAAFQTALNQYVLLPQTSGRIVFPMGLFKISNTLFIEGAVTTGLRLSGTVGGSRGASGTSLIWHGHPGAGMFHCLGVNALTMEHLEIRCDPSTRLKWGVYLDSTITYASTVTVTTSGLVRASNIVTVTTATPHSLSPGMTVRIAGASNAAFNGTFLVLTVPSTTAATYIQTGADGSASGGTTAKYKSSSSSGNIFRDMTIRDTSAPTLTVSTISRDGTYGTVATTAAHYALPGEKIQIAGVTNTSFNGLYVVNEIVSPTSLTYHDTQGSTSSSGGTVLPDSFAMGFGHKDVATAQVSEVSIYDVAMIGHDTPGNSLHAMYWYSTGNVKNYAVMRGTVNGFSIGVDWSNAAGTLIINGLIIGSCAVYDFVTGAGVLTLIGVETESIGGRFVSGSTGGNPGHLNVYGCSVETALASDDVAIQYTGAVVLIGNLFKNIRTGSSYPKIVLGNPLFGGSDLSSLVSLGNHYYYAPAGYVPVYDTSGNQVYAPGAYYENKAVSVISLGDSGGPSGGLYKLNNAIPVAAVVSQRIGSTRVPITGLVRLASTDTVMIANNAGSADLTLLSKNTSDVVQVGDTAGVRVVGSLAVAGNVGFWNVTPVAQPSGIINADGTLADVTSKFNSLVAKLESIGVLAVV